MPTPTRALALRCGLPVFTVALALLVTLLISPLASRTPFALFYAAVAVSAWYGGFKPGLAAIAIAALLGDYFFIPPVHSLLVAPDNLIQVSVFILVALLLNWLTVARTQAEEQAQERQHFIQAMADATPNILYVYDLAEQRHVYVNRGITRNLGYTPEEIQHMATSFFDTLLHPEDLALLPERQSRFDATRNGHVFETEYRMRHKNGEWRWLWSMDRVFKRAADGTPQQIIGIAQDITARKQSEATRRESEERYRLLFESNPLPMWVYDLETLSFLAVNEAAVQHYGYSREEFLAMTIKEIRPPEEVPSLLNRVSQVSSGLDMAGAWRHRKKDGSVIAVEITSHVIDFLGKRAELVLANDITERLRTEQALRESEEQLRASQRLEAVGQLAGGVAHDFNNLLTVITGYSDLLLRRLPEEDSQRQKILEIKQAAERAAALTRQLLAFSRKQVLQPKVLDLNCLVTETSKMLRRLIGEDIELVLALKSALGRVLADPGQLEQVIMNLVVNARDAMPQGGKIIIETHNVELSETYAGMHLAVKPGPYVMLAISDTGNGMDAETQQHIFEPFFTTKEVGKGTGLGLATVYGIVKQSGGNIWLYSEVGRGTTFKIYLPRVEEKAAGPQPVHARAEMLRATETVLLVEDEAIVRALTRSILEESGYQVLEAAHGEEALRACERHEGPIHLLLTDVVMPLLSGRELAERIAQLRPAVRVLYMSGYTDDAIVHHGVLEAGTAFLEKPFTPEALTRKVREVLAAQT